MSLPDIVSREDRLVARKGLLRTAALEPVELRRLGVRIERDRRARVLVRGLEAVDGTPVVDLKPVLRRG